MAFARRVGRRVAPGSTNPPAPLSVNEKATHRMIVEDSLGGAIRLEPTVVRRMTWDASASRDILLNREWLVTNGLGGYVSGTVSGAITRRYHGLLIAALPAPLGRMVMWSHVSEFLHFGEDDVVSLGAEERAGGQLDLHSADYLTEFRLEDGLPIWTYRVRDLVIEKSVLMPHLQNTVQYQLPHRRRIQEDRAWNCVPRASTFVITRCR